VQAWGDRKRVGFPAIQILKEKKEGGEKMKSRSNRTDIVTIKTVVAKKKRQGGGGWTES